MIGATTEIVVAGLTVSVIGSLVCTRISSTGLAGSVNASVNVSVMVNVTVWLPV